jgi:hypothetical protein
MPPLPTPQILGAVTGGPTLVTAFLVKILRVATGDPVGSSIAYTSFQPICHRSKVRVDQVCIR